MLTKMERQMLIQMLADLEIIKERTVRDYPKAKKFSIQLCNEAQTYGNIHGRIDLLKTLLQVLG